MNDDRSSVLGRYSNLAHGGDASPQGDDEWVTVRLLNFPLQLFAQARQHHDEVMREFALLAMRPPEDRPGHTVPVRLLELIEVLGNRYGTSSERSDAVRDAALERGDESVDLTYTVPRSAGAAMRTLHQLMEEADEFCATEQLLTLAATPLERRFRVWFIEQFTSQLDGGAPIPWSGPMRDTTDASSIRS